MSSIVSRTLIKKEKEKKMKVKKKKQRLRQSWITTKASYHTFFLLYDEKGFAEIKCDCTGPKTLECNQLIRLLPHPVWECDSGVHAAVTVAQ